MSINNLRLWVYSPFLPLLIRIYQLNQVPCKSVRKVLAKIFIKKLVGNILVKSVNIQIFSVNSSGGSGISQRETPAPEGSTFPENCIQIKKVGPNGGQTFEIFVFIDSPLNSPREYGL